MTLQESVALTYETNPSLLASRAELLASDENVSQANAAWRPTVTSSLSAGVSDTKTERQGITTTNATGYPRTGRLSITQPLFTGGETAAVIAGAEADVQAPRASLFNSEQDILLQGVVAYVNVLREQATLDLTVKNPPPLQ